MAIPLSIARKLHMPINVAINVTRNVTRDFTRDVASKARHKIAFSLTMAVCFLLFAAHSLAGTITQSTMADFQNVMANAAYGESITFRSSVAGINAKFTDDIVNITSKYNVISGKISNDLSNKILQTSSQITSQIFGLSTDSNSEISNIIYNQINSLSANLTNNMTYIKGDNKQRFNRNIITVVDNNYDSYLTIKDIHFSDFLLYFSRSAQTAGGFANTFIGNNRDTTRAAFINGFFDNSVTNITVKLA
ncbi:MAG: hypothetical protein LBT62_08110, partial [Deltaproteobacteria bacterium]|nr:hypothetical protein [Deltaproteobacteria bacterium]